MSGISTPHSEAAPAGNENVEIRLSQAGWASYLSQSEGTMSLFAARSEYTPDIPPEVLLSRFEQSAALQRDGEELIVGTTEEESIFRGRTYVDYRGTNPVFLDHIVNELAEASKEAATQKPSLLGRFINRRTVGAAGSLATVGAVFAAIHRK